MDGTGRLFGPLVAALPRVVHAVPVTYPGDHSFGYRELLPLVGAHSAGRAYVVLGESFSGPLALLHAATRPQNLQAVVLVASFAKNPTPRGLTPLLSALGAMPFRITAPKAIVRFLLTGFDAPTELVRDAADVMRRSAPGALAHRLRAVFDVDVRDQLSEVDVPVLYLLGTRDRLVGRRGLRCLRESLPNMQVMELDAPHLLLQRRPAEAAGAIVTFLREIGCLAASASASSRGFS